MTAKNDDFTQLARTSDANGDSPIAPAPANDGLCPLCDPQGRLIVQVYTGSPVITGPQSLSGDGAQVLTRQVKASAGTLYQAWGAQDTAVQLWLMLFNIAAGPPAGVPFIAAIPVNTTNGMFSMSFGEGLTLGTGIHLAFSTTPYAYAVPVAGGSISALYR